VSSAFQSNAFQNSAFQVDGITPVPTPQQPTPAGRSKRKRRLERIVVRINGELIEVSSVDELNAVISSLNEEIPQVAEAKAQQIVKEGIRLSKAKKQEKQITVVEAPTDARKLIEARIAEMERTYWMLIQARLDEFERDEEDTWLLMS